jgi:glutamine amidotransferase
MSTVAVIDYGMGNLHSVRKALQIADPKVEVIVTDKAGAIRAADRVVFPGVGALQDCINVLGSRGLDRVITDIAESKPLLGICLGMQALLDFGEENGGTVGLAVISGQVKRFRMADPTLKVPHMGWNEVKQARPHPLWQGIPDNARFYFVHSYYTSPLMPEDIVGQTQYGAMFASALARGSVFGVQFHPEKSQKHGLQLLKNFLSWDGKV